ncbi:MAG: hypothetical protein ABI823_01335 [Bryobacteraceae bacterium]
MTRRTTQACLLVALAASVALAAPEVSESETKKHTFTGVKELGVDTLWGEINVEGYSGSEVQVEVVKTIKAENQAAMDRAKKDVKLDVTNTDGRARLYVDGPFRCNCGDGDRGWRWNDDDRRYRVRYDFTIKVPRGVNLDLRTVNDAGIKVKNTAGNFALRSVNSGIEMTDVEGSGSVRTVNGPVKATFAKNPTGECEFHTVNGKVDIGFRPGFGANLRMKTMNGGLFTDFDVAPLPAEGPEVNEKRGTKYVYRSNRFTRVKVGPGGPDMRFETLNGDVLIRKQ